MGNLIAGVWRDEPLPEQVSTTGEFRRIESRYRDRITADGSSGFAAEAGRYHLYVTHSCPWAHRTLLFRALKKLERVISVSYALPYMGPQGWILAGDPEFPECTGDAVNGFRHLYEAYVATDPRYTGRVTVPTLWDTKTKRIVNNESAEIVRMLNAEFDAFAGDHVDYYPAPLRAEIDRVNDLIYRNVSGGVYGCGFALSQAAYDAAYDLLFATLDELEARLGRQRYLVGRQITEADWLLLPTLVRFDVVYHPLFKCNRQRIADYPNLSNYMRELYGVPGVAATVKPRAYVRGYWAIKEINPTGVIPRGTPIDLTSPHDRARLAA